MSDVTLIRDHIRTLFGNSNGGDAPGWLSIFAAPSVKDRPNICEAFAGDDMFGETPEHIACLADEGYNVYVGMCLQRDNPGPYSRGTREKALAMPGVWWDGDIRGPNHKQDKLPATVDEVLDFVAGLPLQPTCVIHSGGGIQVSWLFDMLEVIENEEDRALAQRLSSDVQGFINERGKEMGWVFDNTSDLARVLRVAGTANHKSAPPQPVRILWQSDARYAPADLRPMCAVKKVEQSKHDNGTGTAGDEARLRAFIAHANVGGWDIGNRDNCAWAVAKFCRDKLGLSYDGILEWLRVLNRESGKPLPDAVLKEKATRAGKRAA